MNKEGLFVEKGAKTAGMFVLAFVLMFGWTGLYASELEDGWSQPLIDEISQKLSEDFIKAARKSYSQKSVNDFASSGVFPEEEFKAFSTELFTCITNRASTRWAFNEFLLNDKKYVMQLVIESMVDGKCEPQGLLKQLTVVFGNKLVEGRDIHIPDEKYNVQSGVNLSRFHKSCGIKKGDDISKVKEYYDINYKPTQMMAASPVASYYNYHLPQYGVWVFFTKERRVKSLRFDSPYLGSINGIFIGDSEERLLEVMGAPQKKLNGLSYKGSGSEGWSYNSGRLEWVRYDVDAATSKVRHILVSSCVDE